VDYAQAVFTTAHCLGEVGFTERLCCGAQRRQCPAICPINRARQKSTPCPPVRCLPYFPGLARISKFPWEEINGGYSEYESARLPGGRVGDGRRCGLVRWGRRQAGL